MVSLASLKSMGLKVQQPLQEALEPVAARQALRLHFPGQREQARLF
jgi:hypothetical protein